MKTIIIAAVAENGIIGSDGKIPWHLPADLKHFKQLTEFHPVIMGRKTYQSLPAQFCPLPNRLNYVISHNPQYKAAGAFVLPSLEQAIQCAANKTPFEQNIDYDITYIIGGGTVYQQAMGFADALEITHIQKTVSGDTIFPTIDLQIWQEISRVEKQGYDFVRYERKER